MPNRPDFPEDIYVDMAELKALPAGEDRWLAKSLLDGGQLPASLMVQDEPTFMALQSITDELGIQMLVSPRKYRAFPER